MGKMCPLYLIFSSTHLRKLALSLEPLSRWRWHITEDSSLGLNTSSAIYQLCDLGPVACPLCASLNLSIKGE